MDNNTDETLSDSFEKTEEAKKIIHELCELLVKSGDANFMFDFFECLFSPSELKDIADRWLLVKEIGKGTSQREIARKFKMSLCKITRGSKELQKKDSAFKKMLDLSEDKI